MKIAIYVPSWPPGSIANGIVTYASQLVPALRRLGHEVFVLTADEAPDCKDPYTVDVRNFSSRRNFWHSAMFRLAPATAAFNTASSAIATALGELHNKHELDVFEIEESFGWNYLITRLNILPVVVRLHGPWFLTSRFNDADDRTKLYRFRQEWEGRGIRHAHLVTSPSVAVLEAAKKHYRLDLAKSRVIPNPLDAASQEKIWSIETCDHDSILFVGRFDKLKGGDLVLRAFGKIAPAYPKLKLIFVGPDRGITGPNNELLTFEHFVRRNLSESRQSRIQFRGQMDHPDVMSLRTTSLCTIIASQHENMPYSVLEAMSLGCPLVVTAVGGIPEVIKDQRNGLTVPSQDEEAMISACRKLLDNHALAARLGRQAWRDCRELYDPETVAKQTIGAYREAIEIFRFRNNGSSVSLG
jgi:glycosyltransferase involved in cell wall biosynthesis